MARTSGERGSTSLAVLLALLVLLPLALGGNRRWAIGLAFVIVLGLLLVTWFSALRSGSSPWVSLKRGRGPLTALTLYAVLVALQLASSLVPSLRAPLANAGFQTADEHQTLIYLIRSVTYVGAFALVLLLVTSVERLRLVLLVLLAAGLAQALIAIVLHSVGAQYQFLWYDVNHGPQAIGTFANRNHLAAYLYLSLSLGIGWMVGSIDETAARARRARDHVITALKFLLSRKMLLRIALVVMVIALVLTRSRMGNAAFFTALIVLGAVVAVTRPALRKRALLLVVSLLLVDVLVIGQWVGLERVMARIEGTAMERTAGGMEESVEARTEPARHTVPMVRANPWFGTGGGSYYTAFPPYKTPGMVLYFDHAHSDYAEIAADTGLVGLGLLALAVFATLWRVRRLVGAGQAPEVRGLGYGAVMAVVCIAMHSWVDYNLQIPANALFVTVILALVWAAPTRARSGSGSGN